MSAPAIIDTARRFAADVIAPHAEHWERIGRVPYDAFEQAGAAGLCGLRVPIADGGQGLSIGGMAAVMECLAAADMNAAFAFVVHNNLAAYVAAHGTTAQRERYLGELIAGRQVGAFLLTEPHAGSDAQSITTHAERTATGWTLTGDKAWVSNGTFADTLSVYAQTRTDAGAAGIAAFLVPADSPGITRTDAYDVLRGRALGVCAVRFDACEVGDDALVLAPGTALQVALGGIDDARINVAAMCCGMLRTSLAVAVRYAAERTAFGRATLDFQGLEWELADCATALEAATLLTREAVTRSERGDSATLAAAHAKKFATRAAFDGIAACMQAMGAAGYTTAYPLARHLAAAKMAQFLDGTTGIQNVVIGRSLRSAYGGAE